MLSFDWATVAWTRYNQDNGNERWSAFHYTKDQRGYSNQTLCSMQIPDMIEGVVEVWYGIGTARLCSRCEKASITLTRKEEANQQLEELRAHFLHGMVNICEIVEATGYTPRQARALLQKIARQDYLAKNIWRLK